MKLMRTISFIILGILLVSFVLGNIFYLQIRKWVDRSYIPVEMTEDEIAQFNLKKNPDYLVMVYTDKAVYNKYEKVKVFARILKKEDNSIPENSVVEISFQKSGNVLSSLGGNDKIKLIYNQAQKVWVGYWYPGDPDVSGKIEVKALGYPDNPSSSIEAKNWFYITDLVPKFTLRKGQALIGIDSLERISKRNILSMEGKEVDWTYIPEWLNQISADGILMLGGVTKTFQEEETMDSPWDSDKVSETLTLADRVKQRSKSFGTWLNGLKVEGIYTKKLGYKPAYYFKDDKYSEENTIISLQDENRKKGIIKLFSTFMDNDSVSYVGISDMFMPDNMGIEMMDRFVREFQMDVPNNWDSLDNDSKMKYFVSKLKDKSIMDKFVFWKQYVVAEYLREVIEKSGHKKPVFYYLDYQEVLDNPDLVFIVLNAGVDFIVMNFNIPFDTILENLDKISKLDRISRYYNRVIVSYYIDYKNTDMRDYDISAIENYVNANLELVKYGSSTLNAAGIMINDLYKAMFGKRGPYSPYEWMLGIGETIYQFKSLNKAYPVDIDFSLPVSADYGSEITNRIEVVNTSAKSVANFRVDILPVTGKPVQRSTIINILQPGKGDVMNLPLELSTNTSQFVRKKSFVGIRVSWESGSEAYGNAGFVIFKSIDLLQPGVQTNNTNNAKPPKK